MKRTESRPPQHPAFAGPTTLAYQDELGGSTALFRVELEAGGDVQMTIGAAVHKPAVSPDGRWVGISARFGGAWELFIDPLDLPAPWRDP